MHHALIFAMLAYTGKNIKEIKIIIKYRIGNILLQKTHNKFNIRDFLGYRVNKC